MEPRAGTGVGETVQRLSPTAIAAIALAALLLIIVAFMVFRGGSTEDDRLTNAVTAAREDPEKLCSSQATYDLIERDLFRQAAALRESDKATFEKLQRNDHARPAAGRNRRRRTAISERRRAVHRPTRGQREWKQSVARKCGLNRHGFGNSYADGAARRGNPR